MELRSNINWNQELYFIDLFKLVVASRSWRIPERRSNRIFNCHITRIFKQFQRHYLKPEIYIKPIHNLIETFKRNSYPQLLGNLLFEHFDKFQVYISSASKKVESNIFLEKEFKRLFHDQSYFLVIVIHVQVCKHSW